MYWFYYDTSGRLWLAVDGAGDYDAEEDELSDTVFGIAAEYRYDGGRQRYMVRLRDPNDDWAVMSDGDWTDYQGDSVHRNYSVTPSSGVATEGVSRLAGVGYDDGGEDGPMYYAGDQIGSTRRVTDSTACTSQPSSCEPALVARRIFSAFGEPIDTANSGYFNELHYGYAGAYGYEEANAGGLDPLAQLGWLHVGERYYAPELGRFAQRDPIGIRGGVNTYLYVGACNLRFVDPSGLDWKSDWIGFMRWVYSPLTDNRKEIDKGVRFAVQVAYVDTHQAVVDTFTFGLAPDFTRDLVFPMSAWGHKVSVSVSRFLIEVACSKYDIVTHTRWAVRKAATIWNALY